MIAGLATGRVEPALAIYFGASPVIHVAHRQPGWALLALSVRAGLPAVAGVIGSSFDSDCSASECPPRRAMIGLLVGGLAAIAVDAIWLAIDRR